MYITTFYAMKRKRERKRNSIFALLYQLQSTNVYRDDFRNYNNFWRQKICPHIQLAMKHFFALLFILCACVTVLTILLCLSSFSMVNLQLPTLPLTQPVFNIYNWCDFQVFQRILLTMFKKTGPNWSKWKTFI